MASKTTNYNLDMPAYNEIADIDVINGNMDKIDMQMKKNADSAQQSKDIVSDEYSATSTYAVGDYCIRENVLYKCKTAITTGEVFDSNKWIQTTCGTEFGELNSNVSDLNGDLVNLKNGNEYLNVDFVSGLATSDGTIDTENTLYECATKTKVFYDRDITITVEDGYQFFLRWFNSDGSYNKTTGWVTTSQFVPKDSIFMLTIKKHPDDYLDRPVPNEIKKKLTIETFIEQRISDLEKNSTLYENKWNGKQWFAFGTSISDSSCNMPFESDGVTGKYPSYLVELSGLVHHNYAQSGSTICNMAVTNSDGQHPTVIQKIDEAIQQGDIVNADLITIEGFVNDWGASNVCPIGELTDTSDDNNNDTTLYMAMHTALTKLTEVCPNARIVFISDSTGKEFYPPYTGNKVGDLGFDKISSGYHQRDYIDAMRKFCEYTGTLFIDAGQISEINKFHPQYIGDHIHHSELGGEQYAKAIWSVLKNIEPNVK